MRDYSLCSDDELHDFYLAGDKDAGNALALRYQELVGRCAVSLFLAGGDREDLLQEGMIGLLAAMRDYRREGGASFRSFAELCIRRRLVSATRSASRRKHAPLNEGVPLDELQAEDAALLQESVFQRSAEDSAIGGSRIDDLLAPYTDLLSAYEFRVLREYLRGYTYREIGKRTESSEKSVDNAIQRIRHKLSKAGRSSGDPS